MGKVKKEHYVPQCYLKNFHQPGKNDKINVFDKVKLQIRQNQNILDIASERYFYDINIDKIMAECSKEKRQEFLKKLKNNLSNYDEQFVEKFFSNEIENNYAQVLKSIINKFENATSWYIKNCFCMNEREKSIMSICITLQFWRTKKQRKFIKEGVIKLNNFYYSNICNLLNEKNGKYINSNDINTIIGKEAIKLTHAEFIFDIDNILNFSNIFMSHFWVLYINRTDVPFWTSDSPIVLNSTEHGKLDGKGVGSKGIEILLPLNDRLTLGIYDRKKFERTLFSLSGKNDRIYVELDDVKEIERINRIQVFECYRCVYSSSNDFKLAKEICEKNPKIREEQEYIEIL